MACGTGILTFAVAQQFPECRVTGIDLRDEYLDLARGKAVQLNRPDIKWIQSRAEDLTIKGSFDVVTSSYLAKYADLKRLVQTLSGIIPEGGLILFHDFTYPPNRVAAAGWELYFKLMCRLARKQFPEWHQVFEGLPDLLRRTTWVPDLQVALKENGFQNIQVKHWTLGASALITARKSGQAPKQQTQTQ